MRAATVDSLDQWFLAPSLRHHAPRPVRPATPSEPKAIRLTTPRVLQAMSNGFGKVRVPLKDKLFRQYPIPFCSQARLEWLAKMVPLCPYGIPGDALWVRETWLDALTCRSALQGNEGVVYYADSSGPEEAIWRPSSNMPRWASRMKVRLTSVGIEALKDISDEDAQLEGVVRKVATSDSPPGYGVRGVQGWHSSARAAFAEIAGKDDWLANRWCWVLGYRVEEITRRQPA